MDFLPLSKDDVRNRGWVELDIIFVSGDAYVDHPAWAAAILGRYLEYKGYRVGIIAQPDWRNLKDISQLGAPRLFFAVSAGNLDSMVSHYTADKKKRRRDMYSPGGQAGLRPDRATIVYCNLVRQAFPGIPVVIGGVEASLRRLAHYDYWSDTVRRSILLDSKADLLVYGMGEHNIAEIARRLKAGQDISHVTNLKGTCYLSNTAPSQACIMPSYEQVREDKREFVRATRMLEQEMNPYCSRVLAQAHGDRWVVQNPPSLPLATEELDEIYSLPFTRRSHPGYDDRGGVPGLAAVQFSIVTHRGCFGGCAFCSLGMHQGRFIQSRSQESIMKEALALVKHPDFKGTIPDVGGPSANMYHLRGLQADKCHSCRRSSCLYPRACSNLDTDHSPSVKLWKELRQIPGLKHLFVSSGVRYDLVLNDRSGRYLPDLCRYHVGGQLKIAPEHISDRVTRLMRKPGKNTYLKFMDNFQTINQKLGKEQYIIPYFISAHPGCEVEDNLELAEFIRDKLYYHPEQIQDFTPTPMTVSTCMYYSGIDPVSGQPVHVPLTSRERRWQRALLQHRDQRGQALAREALRSHGREDLIGNSPQALVKERASSRPRKESGPKPKNKPPSRRK